MKILRTILGAVLGYAVFVISAVALFQLAKIDPHAEPTISTLLIVIGSGIVFSFLGGLLAQAIAGQRSLTVNYILTVVLGGFALFSLLKTTGHHYSQYAAIFLFAPASFLGGVVFLRRRNSRS